MAQFQNIGQDLDGNRRTINGNTAFRLESSWTFAAATTGAIGPHTVFSVTGKNLVTVFAAVDTTLNDAGAPTIELGVVGNTAALIAQSLAKSLATGEVWVDGTLTRLGVGAIPAAQIITGIDITLTIASATVTSGVLDFFLLWRPLSSNGNITVTTPA